MMSTLEYPAPMDRTYYLSGPISGDIPGNEAKFAKATEALKERGYSIVSPVEVTVGHLNALRLGKEQQAWDWFMRRDIEALVADSVTGIIMLPGWEYSKGAQLELQIAKGLNYYITTLGECLVRPVKVRINERADGSVRPSPMAGGPDGQGKSVPEGAAAQSDPSPA